MLPGNQAISAEIRRRLAASRPLAVLYTDIDYFKAYNDVYGYEQGNVMIHKTAQIIQELQEACGDDIFVGHIGGDDFIVLCDPTYAEPICTEICARFDREIPRLYNYKHQVEKKIVCRNRQGHIQEFPLATISIAIVTNEHRAFQDPLEIAAVAAEVKKLAKSQTGSTFVRDRRIGTITLWAEEVILNYEG
jgi:diguanylate cyclase (GGDEF)-like protein